jgi:hypothetical protein
LSETILLAKGEELIRIPRENWEDHLAQVPEHSGARLGFMSEDHHRVRYFVVQELPGLGEPLMPGYISKRLKLPMKRVAAVLEELERNLFFLVRDSQGAVTWAFPVTTVQTPHTLVFSTGERLYGA